MGDIPWRMIIVVAIIIVVVIVLNQTLKQVQATASAGAALASTDVVDDRIDACSRYVESNFGDRSKSAKRKAFDECMASSI